MFSFLDNPDRPSSGVLLVNGLRSVLLVVFLLAHLAAKPTFAQDPRLRPIESSGSSANQRSGIPAPGHGHKRVVILTPAGVAQYGGSSRQGPAERTEADQQDEAEEEGNEGHESEEDGEESAHEPEEDGAETADEQENEEGADWIPGEISGELALVSDYAKRGISSTDHNPALQGGLSYSVDIGLESAEPYVGFWGSNVDFDDGGEATLELEFMFGLTGTVADLEWDIGAIRYHFPGASSDLNYDYWEYGVSLSYPLYQGLSLSGNYYYSPEYSGKTGQAHYLEAVLGWQRPMGPVVLGLQATTGHQWIEDNTLAGVKDRQDWSIGATLTIEKITLGVTYTDTNLSKQECFGGTNLCDPRAVFSLSTAF
jgi:uncharacterized protein (TIGR02001 family)